jgi:hypothetical protein
MPPSESAVRKSITITQAFRSCLPGLSDTCLTHTQILRQCPSETNLDRRVKTGLFPVFRYHSPIRPEIMALKASISEHFRGHFIPKSGKKTAIIAYSKIHVPEFAIFCNQFRKIILPVGEARGMLPSENPGLPGQERMP